jgi:cell division protein FtsL
MKLAKYVHGNLAVQEPYQQEEQQRKPRSKSRKRLKNYLGERGFYMLLIVIFVAVAMLVISRYAAVYKLNLQAEELQAQIKLMQYENNELKLKVSQLADLKTIREDAKTIGLQPLDVKEINKIGYQPADAPKSEVVSNQQ